MTMTTLCRFVCGVSTNSVSVGSEPGASLTSISGVASSLTIMFAKASLEKALPAPVVLGSSDRQKKENAARQEASPAGQGRPTFRVGRSQRWVEKLVMRDRKSV